MLEHELNSYLRYGNPCSLIMIDVDYFKAVNDTHGHQLGDSVLIEFAKLLSDSTRVTHTVGRWGGGEFLVVCPDTDTTAAFALAEKLRKLIESHVFPVIGSKKGRFGVASFRINDAIDVVISRADAALYQAKDNGRNKVEIGT